MSKVLVIGGAGFIGSHTVVELIKAGYDPVILDNLDNSSADVFARLRRLTGKEIPFYQQDYTDADATKNLLQTETPESVIHFAAYKAVGESVEQPLKYYENNVSGFVTLLKALSTSKVKRIVLSSSAAVYGKTPASAIDETTQCTPESPYGWSKYMDEVILQDFCRANPDFTGVGLRYFNVVGADESGMLGELPKGKPQNLLPLIIRAIEIKKPLAIYGTDYPTEDGTCLRDYVHVTDLAQAHIAALRATSPGYDVFNVGTGKPTSVLGLINTFETVNNVKVPYEKAARRPGDPAICYALPNKINKNLGWSAHKTVEDAVRDAWKWHQSLKTV